MAIHYPHLQHLCRSLSLLPLPILLVSEWNGASDARGLLPRPSSFFVWHSTAQPPPPRLRWHILVPPVYGSHDCRFQTIRPNCVRPLGSPPAPVQALDIGCLPSSKLWIQFYCVHLHGTEPWRSTPSTSRLVIADGITPRFTIITPW